MLNNWKVMNELDIDLKSKIKIFCIFGLKGEEVMFVTNEDNVYAFGSNSNGLLGLGHNYSADKPSIVKELCNKEIIDIRHGSKHMIALSKTGLCYSWGLNFFGELGNGSKVADNVPKVINSLSDKIIISIDCGFYHTLVVTDCGKVYGFGINNFGQIGCNSDENVLTPILINSFNNERVKSVSCGFGKSLALTQSGRVFSWCHISKSLEMSPQLINMKGVIVSQIMCGFNHSLLLTNGGNVYAFGDNSCGQIGTGNTVNANIPQLVINNNKICSIASSLSNDISVAKSEEGFCYVWGQTVDQNIVSPKETSFASIEEVFAFLAKNKTTHKPIYIEVNNTILERQLNAFNNQELSDFQFIIENKVIFAHKMVLKMNCNHFKTMFSNNWDQNNVKRVEMDLYSYQTYYAFLKYLYSSCVEIGIKDVIELYDLANSYFEEDLKLKCIQIIKNEISIENAFTLYSSALKYNSEELEKFCFEFMSKNMNDVCNTQAFQKLDPIVCKHFIEKYAKLRRFK